MEDLQDIVVEALEVFINHILYVRDLYPGQIFKKRRIYNTPVFVSIYPPLNTYLYKVLRTSRELLKTSELECVEVILYRDDHTEYERYKFKAEIGKNNKNEDEFLLDFEEQLRGSLSILAERLKGLEKLPSDAQFRVLVHTTQSAFIRLTHNSNYQDFPWLRADLKPSVPQQEISLLPLTCLRCIGLNLTAEIF
ncbi:DNA polymerase zeta subunit 2 [Calliphora vicina]|uniref:DNA polymerase zeta subunit 2 n=1 Tax=Calliphora vicina TaxID=7373 RepID=UPI00325B45DB